MRLTPKFRRRNGLTLVEIVAAMATMTMVLGVSIALLTVLFKLSDSGRKHAADEFAIARAARLFRQDLRSADSIETRPSGKPSPSLTLQLDEGLMIEYLAERDGLLRIESCDGAIVEQEHLSLPDWSSPRFERRNENGLTFVTFVFDRRPSKTSPKLANREFRIEATVGADSRFDQTGGTTR